MHPVIASHFVSVEQQRDTHRLGMWAFLASEVLLFGGLFTGYTAYRSLHGEGFVEGSEHLYQSIGLANTAVLLISSLTMALGVHAAREGRRQLTVWLLSATATLGLAFLALKVGEYILDYRESIVPGVRFDESAFEDVQGARLFFLLYFIMTGLHAVHLLAAVSVVSVSAVLVRFERLHLGPTTLLEPIGLYWHLVDLIWVFLLPMLYLIS